MSININQRVSLRAKLITLFIVIKVIPLILLALIAWQQTLGLSKELNSALNKTKQITIESTTRALTDLARENVERLSTDMALNIAKFLYARDYNIIQASTIPINTEKYELFLKTEIARMHTQKQWVMDEDDMSKGASWKPLEIKKEQEVQTSSNTQNDAQFNYRPSDTFEYETVPFFQEITFIDLDGQELVKATSSPLMDKELKDISKKENTFIKAESYFPFLTDLKQGEIYVSDVIGAYVPAKIVSIYNQFNAKKAGIDYDPENATYAGWENPVGKPFQGIVRWATPVYKDGEKIGYVTLALDYSHILSVINNVTPTGQRYVDLPDASDGNYVFLWDHKGRNIGHPRHYYIVGYDPKTGNPAIPALEESLYDRWLVSGQSYVDFIVNEPTFVDQNRNKKPAPALTKDGLVAIDCRYSNFAPQCIGWVDLTKEGGSGSFIIEWDGLSKLTSAAAIPYYTGNYAKKKAGFGFVTMTVNLDDFLKPVIKTNNEIETIIKNSNEEIDASLIEIAYALISSTAVMTFIVIAIAIWLASILTQRLSYINKGILKFRNGERRFRFNEPVQDEIGALCTSFDFMADSIDQNNKSIFTITNLNDIVIYSNASALKSFGLTIDQVVGSNYHNVTTFGADNPLARYHKQLPQAIMQHVHTKRYYQGSVEKFYNDKQVHIGYMLTIGDINDIFLQQQEVALQRHLLLTIFTSSPDIIWYKNAQNQYLSVNPRFCSMIGKDCNEIIDQSAFDILPKNVIFNDMTHDNDAKESKKSVYSEEKYIFQDGHYELLEIVRTPIYDKNNEFKGIVGVAHDMSDRITKETRLKEIQLGLEKAVLDANKANTAKSNFLTRMSHEIRTPMNAIIGMSTIAKDNLSDPKAIATDMHFYISQIDISAKHLLCLVNEILETAKSDSTAVELKKDVFNMGTLSRDVLTIVNSARSETQVKINLDIPNLENKTFLSDATRIRQMIITLLSNAIEQADPDGTVTFKVTQEQVSKNECRFGFTIHDDGAPMSKMKIDALQNTIEENDILFNSKIMEDNFNLSLCQQIVSLLGGSIKVQSSVNGNTLTFSFLLKQAEEKGTEPFDLRPLEGRRVLLVDDIEINRIVLKALLKNIKVEIEEASDGSVAVDMFTNSPVGYYDIIFMDIQMPTMNGFEATQSIRQLDRPDANTIPILAITANSFQEDIQKTLDCGMSAHFPKPVDRDSLFMTMLQLLKNKK